MDRETHTSDSGFDAELTRSSLPAVLVLATLAAIVFVAVAYFRIQSAHERAALERLQHEDEATREDIVNVVMELQTRLGRPPESESELVTLMGRPMPKVHLESITVPIHYEQHDRSFHLKHQSLDHDFNVFDGNNPTAGWVGVNNF